MKEIILLPFLLITVISCGQKINYSITLKYQQPYISDISENVPIQMPVSTTTGFIYYTSNFGVEEEYSSPSGGLISGNIKYVINSKLFVQSGLRLNLVRYKQLT